MQKQQVDWKNLRSETSDLLRTGLLAARRYVWRYTIWVVVITGFLGWLGWYGLQKSSVEDPVMFFSMACTEIACLSLVVAFYTVEFKAEQDKQLQPRRLSQNPPS